MTETRQILCRGDVEIWRVTEEGRTQFYVYGVTESPRVVPSEEMARALAAKALT